MKKLISGLLICSALLTSYVPTMAEDNVWREFYVSPSGSDQNPGTKDAPFATVAAARDAVRKINNDMQGDIVVNIAEGDYYQDVILEFRSDDSGKNGHRVIYRGVGEERPVISGGMRVTNFTKSEYEGIYVADVDLDVIPNISVNNVKRHVAKGARLVTGQIKPEKYRSDEWYATHPNDVNGDDYNWYDPETPARYDGMFMSKQDFGKYDNIEDVLFVWNMEFNTSIVPVEEVLDCEEDSSLLKVRMNPGLWNWALLNGDSTLPKARRDFTIMNAFELLDEPGEFYFNRKTKKLYYMPTETEDMDTAKIVVPVLDTVMNVDGYDITNKAKNITFEHLQFSDSKWNFIDGAGFLSQSDQTLMSTAATTPPGVLVQRADGITMKDNIFCNIGGTGLRFATGVSNSDIIGNAIYDIGDTGLVLGGRNNGTWGLGDDAISDPVPEDKKNAPVDLVSMETTKIDLSYLRSDRNNENGYNVEAINWPGYPDADNTTRNSFDEIPRYPVYDYMFYMLNYTWADYTLHKSIPANWQDSHSATKGEKAWVKFEFIRPYSIDKISVSFKEEYLKDGQNANYEILVSNDPDFKEGSYKVVARQDGAAPEAINHYEFNDDTKYRFVLIRKTIAEDFALGRVWIESTDEKPYIKNERPHGIKIENNAMQRIADTAVGRGYGLQTYQIAYTDINHNEIHDTGYAGLGTGLAWNDVFGNSTDVNMHYNYVYNTNQTGHDGAGIYILGMNPNSLFSHNYVRMTGQSVKGFYTDNGSSYYTMDSNFVDSDSYVTGPYVQGMGHGAQWHLYYKDFYGTNSQLQLGSGWQDRGIKMDPLHIEVIGQPSRGNWDTYTNAGLEDEYKYLLDLIPDGHNNLYYKYSYNEAAMTNERGNFTTNTTTGIRERLENLINEGKFGHGLGYYPLSVKSEAEEMLDYFNGSSNSDLYMRVTLAREFTYDVADKLNRYSNEETLKLCEELLTSAKGEDATLYSDAAIKGFEDAITKAKAMDVSVPEIEFDQLVALEDAYNKMLAGKYSTDIADIYVPGAQKVEINKDTKTVTAYMPYGAKFEVENLVITPEGDGIVAKIMDKKLDLTKEQIIPMYSKGTNTYETWTLKTEYMPYSPQSEITGKVWQMNTNETNLIKYTDDGVTLPGSYFAYMSEIGGGDKNTSISFKPMTPNDTKELTMLFGANSPYGFEYGDKGAEYNRCEVVFRDNQAMFYKVDSGKKTLIDTAFSSIKWNEKNDLQYEITEINNNTHFKIRLNGTLIFSEVIQKCTYGRYMGIYNPSTIVKVY